MAKKIKIDGKKHGPATLGPKVLGPRLVEPKGGYGSKRKKYMMNTDGTVHFFNKGGKVSKYYKDGGIVITGRD